MTEIVVVLLKKETPLSKNGSQMKVVVARQGVFSPAPSSPLLPLSVVLGGRGFRRGFFLTGLASFVVHASASSFSLSICSDSGVLGSLVLGGTEDPF